MKQRYVIEEQETHWRLVNGRQVPFSHMLFDTRGGMRPIALVPSQAIALQLAQIVNQHARAKKRAPKSERQEHESVKA